MGGTAMSRSPRSRSECRYQGTCSFDRARTAASVRSSVGSDRTHRGAQRLAADCADVVIRPDPCQAPQDVVGRAVEIRTPLTLRRRQTFRLQLRIVARCEGFKSGDDQSAAVLARLVDRCLFGIEHDHTVVKEGRRTANCSPRHVSPSAADPDAATANGGVNCGPGTVTATRVSR